jgi:spore coat protein A
MTTRRSFLKLTGASTLAWYVATQTGWAVRAMAAIPGGSLDPADVPKFQTAMLIPPVMPRTATITMPGGKPADYYEISMRQISQRILPAGLPETTVWAYGPLTPDRRTGLRIYHAPSLTIETTWKRPVRVKWINDLKKPNGEFLPHLLPVDPTLHWANPPGGTAGRDDRPDFTGKTYVPLDQFTDPDTQYTQYTGPVPIVTHLHGAAGVGDESDGYAEAWYLPDAGNIPAGYAEHGTFYEFFAGKAASKFGVTWNRGFATFQYPNDQRESTLWYHDHALGMTRLNVYAGPAGFFLVRGGPEGDKAVLDSRTGLTAVLPSPAPNAGDMFPPNKTYYEIPIAVQDRSFNTGGSLFYPDTRAFFDPPYGGPYIPETDVSPIWNPEFFGNMIMVNGNTWPYQQVEKRRYRLRFLNGCQSRFLILDFGDIPGVEVWQIGNEGGFLRAPVNLTADNGNRLLMGLAERADLIVDFTNVPLGNHILRNVGPDEPFGGGEPPGDFDAADPDSTGQVLQFRVVPAVAADPTTPPQFLVLPATTTLTGGTARRLALMEKGSTVTDGPAEAQLGIVGETGTEAGTLIAKQWMDPVTENPAVNTTEIWEYYNATADAHPMHVHEVAFQVVDRQPLAVDADGEVVQPVQLVGDPTPPESWENGWKDTVVAYPGQVTRLRLRFTNAGRFVWHCHIVEHEDNEMMRPYQIGPVPPGQPG